MKIREKIKDQQGIASSLNNIAIIYEDQGDTLKALEYFNKSLDIKKVIGDKGGIATSYNNIGIFYKDQGNFKRALEYQTKGLKIREEIGDKKRSCKFFK
ncbi:MAG: tetratricopeptide repeat protein [Bacteroidetes bacterium]|nr:tetratricopeptide repeat protein [Bacteroidota bacterium]